MAQNFTKKDKLTHGKCREFIDLILDGEASEIEKELVALHLEECGGCNDSYKLEVAIRQALKNKVHPLSPPWDLISLIKEKITTPDTHP